MNEVKIKLVWKFHSSDFHNSIHYRWVQDRGQKIAKSQTLLGGIRCSPKQSLKLIMWLAARIFSCSRTGPNRPVSKKRKIQRMFSPLAPGNWKVRKDDVRGKVSNELGVYLPPRNSPPVRRLSAVSWRRPRSRPGRRKIGPSFRSAGKERKGKKRGKKNCQYFKKNFIFEMKCVASGEKIFVHMAFCLNLETVEGLHTFGKSYNFILRKIY